jgi:hypothetical protein
MAYFQEMAAVHQAFTCDQAHRGNLRVRIRKENFYPLFLPFGQCVIVPFWATHQWSPSFTMYGTKASALPLNRMPSL